MIYTGGMMMLFQYACESKFREFDLMFSELERELPIEEFWEAYLLRMQIKLYAADETLTDDLKKAAEVDGTPHFPCLNNYWHCDTPNRLCVFNKAPGSLKTFLAALPEAEREMRRWHGEVGGSMISQVQSEVLYFMGALDEAMAIAKVQREVERENGTDTMCAYNILFRYYLASGLPQDAKECMCEMADLSKAKPECAASFDSILKWTNLTTGWGGVTPRYEGGVGGAAKPVFEDRLEAIRDGYAIITPLENPFVTYAEKQYRGAVTMRQYYMDIFHTIYWFQVKDYRQAESFFTKIFNIAAGSGLIAPFAEYGRQIVPLLQHAKASGMDCSGDWIDKTIALAEQYEVGLNAYRSFNA